MLSWTAPLSLDKSLRQRLSGHVREIRNRRKQIVPTYSGVSLSQKIPHFYKKWVRILGGDF
jgi:hypothetical protein